MCHKETVEQTVAVLLNKTIQGQEIDCNKYGMNKHYLDRLKQEDTDVWVTHGMFGPFVLQSPTKKFRQCSETSWDELCLLSVKGFASDSPPVVLSSWHQTYTKIYHFLVIARPQAFTPCALLKERRIKANLMLQSLFGLDQSKMQQDANTYWRPVRHLPDCHLSCSLAGPNLTPFSYSIFGKLRKLYATYFWGLQKGSSYRFLDCERLNARWRTAMFTHLKNLHGSRASC